MRNGLERETIKSAGIIHNGIRLEIDENYEPPISPLIHNALQLELDNENPLFFFETENEYVLFGS